MIDSSYRSNYQDWKLLYDSATTTFVANINYIYPGYAYWAFVLSGNPKDLKNVNVRDLIQNFKGNIGGNYGLDSSILFMASDSIYSYNLNTKSIYKYKKNSLNGFLLLYSGSLLFHKQHMYVFDMRSDTIIDGLFVYNTKIQKVFLNSSQSNLEKVIPILDNLCYFPGVRYDELSMDNCGNILVSYATNNSVRCNSINFRSYVYPNHYGIMSIDTNLVLQDTFDFSSGNTIINYKNPLNDSVVVIAGMKVFPDSTYQFVRFINIHRKCETSSHSRFIEQSDVFLYPTITKGELTLNKGEQAGQRFSIIFYSPDGRDCIRKNLEASDSFIDLSLLPDGIYLYTIMDINKQIINSGKIIKQQ